VPAPAFVDKLHEQVGHEFAAHQQYLAIALYFDAQTLPQLAGFFYRQAVEERNHAMMMLGYLKDAGAPLHVPGVAAPENGFSDIAEPVRLALAQIAREAGDYTSEQFVQWFLQEQVEEVSSMNALLTVVERAKDDPMRAEDYLARETSAAAADPTAPPAAGGAL
jgi:ferritin